MPGTKLLTLKNVDFRNPSEVEAFLQQVIATGIERVRSESAELKARGLMDEDGNLLNTKLPPDMKEGSNRDFGG